MSSDPSKPRHPDLDELFARRGAVKAVAAGLRISTAAVSKWRVVPAARAGEVARILGVPLDRVPVAQREMA